MNNTETQILFSSFTTFSKQNKMQSYIISFENETKDVEQREKTRDDLEIKREIWVNRRNKERYGIKKEID